MVSQDQPPPFDPTPPVPPVPPVLAVLVRHASGDRSAFAASLAALAAQDYADLRIVVVDTGGGDDPSELVHDILPTATVHPVPGNAGFGAAANVVLADDGHEIRYFLFCHDDAAPEPAATRGLVEAAETWHAAVVGPKLVRWDDPGRLAQVGEAVTKTGVTVPLVEPGELDDGQHDIVHEAFTVPGAFTLVRADVFRCIGGFDEAISFLGDDLSLCWRARLAGARVVVEPSVRVRHRAGLAERLPVQERQRLLARHRLRVVLTSYAVPDLLWIVPQAALASLVEVTVSLLTLRPSRARAALAAWRWNLARLGSVRWLRRQVQELRQVDDRTIRHLQAPGLIRPHLRSPFDLGPRRRLRLRPRLRRSHRPASDPTPTPTPAATTPTHGGPATTGPIAENGNDVATGAGGSMPDHGAHGNPASNGPIAGAGGQVAVPSSMPSRGTPGVADSEAAIAANGGNIAAETSHRPLPGRGMETGPGDPWRRGMSAATTPEGADVAGTDQSSMSGRDPESAQGGIGGRGVGAAGRPEGADAPEAGPWPRSGRDLAVAALAPDDPTTDDVVAGGAAATGGFVAAGRGGWPERGRDMEAGPAWDATTGAVAGTPQDPAEASTGGGPAGATAVVGDGATAEGGGWAGSGHVERAPVGFAEGGLAGVDTERDWRVALADRLEALRAGWTSGGVIVLLALVGVLVMGSRHLVTRGVPVVGELASFGPPGDLLDEWLSGWRRTGLGSDQPAPTALGALGALGTVASGHLGLLRLLLTLGLIPLGIVGAFRLLRPSGSPRAPVAAALAYACVPVPYAALAHGRWAPLAVYAAAPWLLAHLARATGTAPFVAPHHVEDSLPAGPTAPESTGDSGAHPLGPPRRDQLGDDPPIDDGLAQTAKGMGEPNVATGARAGQPLGTPPPHGQFGQEPESGGAAVVADDPHGRALSPPLIGQLGADTATDDRVAQTAMGTGEPGLGDGEALGGTPLRGQFGRPGAVGDGVAQTAMGAGEPGVGDGQAFGTTPLRGQFGQEGAGEGGVARTDLGVDAAVVAGDSRSQALSTPLPGQGRDDISGEGGVGQGDRRVGEVGVGDGRVLGASALGAQGRGDVLGEGGVGRGEPGVGEVGGGDGRALGGSALGGQGGREGVGGGGVGQAGVAVGGGGDGAVVAGGSAGGGDEVGSIGRGRGSGRPGLVVSVLRVGVVTALLGMVLPVAPLLVLLLTAALVLGSLLAFELRGALRLVVAGVGGSVVATLLHLPWSFDVARSWWSLWREPTDRGPWPGLDQPGSSLSGPVELLASAGSGAALAWWGLVAAAGLVLLVGRQWRLGWGIRGWTVALAGGGAAWGASWLAADGAAGAALPSSDVLLALAGAGLALAVGTGVAAVEHDVAGRSRRFGIRRTATALAFLGLGLATLPLLRGALDGYWDMPQGDVTRLLGFVDDDTAAAVTGADRPVDGARPQADAPRSRVLWVGDPSLLPTPGWPLDPATETAERADGPDRLAYATSEGLPTVADLWPGPVEAPTDRVGQAVQLAVGRQTNRLGALLAPMAVEYVVVPRQLAPGSDGSGPSPASRDLATVLDSQLDLQRIDVDSSVHVYRNTVALPPRALVPVPELAAPAGQTAPATSGGDAASDTGAQPAGDLPADPAAGSVAELLATDLAQGASPAELRRMAALGAVPVLTAGGDDRAVGELPGGAVLLQSAASSEHWRLHVDGTEVASRPAFGWASSFPAARGGEAVLSYDTPGSRHVLLAVQVALWLVAAAGALVPTGRRAHRRPRRADRHQARGLVRVRRRPAHIAAARETDVTGTPQPLEEPLTEPTPNGAPLATDAEPAASPDRSKVHAVRR